MEKGRQVFDLFIKRYDLIYDWPKIEKMIEYDMVDRVIERATDRGCHFYDIILKENEVVVWDHKKDPQSITAGLKGLHLYLCEDGELLGIVIRS